MNYINTTTHTPASRHQIRQDNPNVSLPADPSALQLALLGYAIIEPVKPPAADVVEPGEPEHYATDTKTHTYEVEVEVENETAIEERSEEVEIQRWRQTWISRDFTPDELDEPEEEQVDATALLQQQLDSVYADHADTPGAEAARDAVRDIIPTLTDPESYDVEIAFRAHLRRKS